MRGIAGAGGSGEAASSLYHLEAGKLAVSITDFGATLTRIGYPDRSGRIDNILLGLADLHQLHRASTDPGWWYPGSTIGRFANRIGDAAFTIDGVRHQLAPNEGRHQRHGGPEGFDRRRWVASPLVAEGGLRFELVSPAGDQGFPGQLTATLDVVVAAPATLILRYAARTDAPTHVSLTSHGYFNLDGAPTIDDHQLRIDADRYLPIDADALPTGEVAAVDDTPFDWREPRRIGDALREVDPQLAIADGFNHCFVLAGKGGLHRAAVLTAPASGRRMEVWTTEPGVQLYTGNALGEAAGGPFGRRQALCLETQHWPNSPNQPGFPSTLLRPGETFRSETQLRFSIAD